MKLYDNNFLFQKKKFGEGEFFINSSGTNDSFTTVSDGIQTRHFDVTKLNSEFIPQQV
jgi:hypothetical protein